MKNSAAVLWLAVFAAAVAGCSGSSSTEGNREMVGVNASAGGRERLLDAGWKFFKGDDAGVKEAGFDDKGWRVVDLPHDWSVEGPFDKTLASCTAFLPCGVAWYRKSFELSPDARGKSVFIRFDGVMNHSSVWCNGKLLGERPYGYSSFTYDLTPALNAGGENVIAVRVDHEQVADSRWYAGSGIYRNVFLTVADKVHVATDGVFVTTPESVVPGNWGIKVSTDVANGVEENVKVEWRVLDETGAEVAHMKSASFTAYGQSATFGGVATVSHPKLWSPGHPDLYRLETVVKKDGVVVDRYETPFGIRSFVFDPEKGFSMNGESMKLKGVCLHQDAGALGTAVPMAVWERRLKLLQEAGCNAIRCSHNEPSPEFLDLCDRMGFLVMDEAFDEWTGGKHKWVVGHNVGTAATDGYHSDFEQWADRDIKDMVVRDRNHPSIVMWSIGNEIDYNNDPFPPNSEVLPVVAQRLIKDVKAEDVTRPVTAACAFPATNLYKTFLDVEGYNYMEKLYAGDHAAHPERVIFGSENAHTYAAWEAVEKNDFIAGQFLWTGIDYLGEGNVWPAHGSGSGLLNLAGFPRNQYYYRKSLWTDEPMVYLSTSGLGADAFGRAGAVGRNVPSVYCITNCDSVELFKDGKSLGSKAHKAGELVSWPMEFTGGVLEVVGKKGDAVVRYELKKAGAAAKLVVKSDVTRLQADGRDVAQIEVDVTDADGTVVPTAGNLVTCTIDGPGRILGIENGDLKSTESYQGMTHSAYQGRMMVYVESMVRGEEVKSGETVKLRVTAAGLEGGSVVVPVR